MPPHLISFRTTLLPHRRHIEPNSPVRPAEPRHAPGDVAGTFVGYHRALPGGDTMALACRTGALFIAASAGATLNAGPATAVDL